MRRLTFGIVLLLVAWALLDTNPVMAQIPPSDFPGVRVAYVQDSWNVSANLNKDEFLYVCFTQGADWRQGYFEPDGDFPGFAVLYVGVNITDPRGNTTSYLCILGKQANESEETMLSFLDKIITRNEGGIDPSLYCKNATNSYYEIGGTVQFDGTYEFVIGNVYPNRNDPPASLDVRKVTFMSARLPGVAPGQFMHYEVYSVWNDGNDTELENWARNQPMSGINVTVLSVVNTTVTYQEVTCNSTGTVYNYTRDVDVETGSYSYEYLFIAANLTAGDIVYTRDNNTWINETALANYLGQQLETNHLSSLVNQSHTSFMGLAYEFSASVSQDFYWHRQSGMLLEVRYEFNTTRVSGMDVLVGHFVLSAVAALSIPPVIPEFPSFLILPLFMMVTLLAVAVYDARIRRRGDLRKIAHET